MGPKENLWLLLVLLFYSLINYKNIHTHTWNTKILPKQIYVCVIFIWGAFWCGSFLLLPKRRKETPGRMRKRSRLAARDAHSKLLQNIHFGMEEKFLFWVYRFITILYNKKLLCVDELRGWCGKAHVEHYNIYIKELLQQTIWGDIKCVKHTFTHTRWSYRHKRQNKTLFL